jgi:outer membrane protein OmpA-like peptidoglycan-associated protein
MSLSLNTSSPVVFSGLAPSTDYTFTLRARNGNGWSLDSSASNQIRTLALAGAPAQQTPPAAPTPEQPNPPQATYYGPIPIAIASACVVEGIPSLTSLNGLRLSTIYAAGVDGYSITISQVTSTSLTMEIPALPAGIYDVLYRSDFGELTHQQSLRVCAAPTKAPGNAPNSSSTSTSSSPAPQALIKTATVYFPGDSATLTAKAKRILQSLAKSLRGRGKTSVVVEGYVRRTAITSYDRELSQKRASAVIRYLKLIGLNAQFMSIPRGIHPDDSPRARKAVVRAAVLKS